MTLLSHPQVREAFATYCRGEGTEQDLLTAILTALQAGEELDFDAAMREARANKGQGFGVDSFYRAALNAQHRARLAAEREKWEARVEELERVRTQGWEDVNAAVTVATLRAEVETLRGDMVKLIAARMEDNRESDARLLTAEARVQRLEAALKRYGEHAPSCTYGYSQNRVCDCGLFALLPEETTG